MDEMTHERCSELLHAHARGELERDLDDRVRAHLAACGECRAEERAVAALAAPAPAMDEFERARLHRSLTQELFSAPANADVAGAAGPRSWRRWIAPAAGAAALVAGIAFVGLAGGLSGSDEETGGSGLSRVGAPARDADGADELESESDAGAGGSGSGGGVAGRPEPAAEAGQAESRAGLADGGPAPEFDGDAGTLTTRALSETGRSGDVFTSFAATYTAADVEGLAEDFVGRLARSAGEAGADVRACGGTLPDDATILPAYGALGEYAGEDVLVIGFVTTESGGPLDRYLMWIWARGSCAQPIDTLVGGIDR